MPFLENVVRGRNVPEERLQKVAQQYYSLGGKSPINEINRSLLKSIGDEFSSRGIDLPLYFGNRNSSPFLKESLEAMRSDGRTNAISFVTSAYGSFSGCKQYKLDVTAAQEALGHGAPQVTKIRHYYSHPGFINPFVQSTLDALASASGGESTHLVFSAHSLPVSMALSSPYLQQLRRAKELVELKVSAATGVSLPSHLAFQSRSGPPSEPWLEPDISDLLESLRRQSVSSVVVVPIGFISDHMEVVYDIDVVAAGFASRLGIEMRRAATPSHSAEFISMIADLAVELIDPHAPKANLGDLADLNGCSTSCCPVGALHPEPTG